MRSQKLPTLAFIATALFASALPVGAWPTHRAADAHAAAVGAVGPTPSPLPTATSTATSGPTDMPTGVPSGMPTGRPTDRPGPRPTKNSDASPNASASTSGAATEGEPLAYDKFAKNAELQGGLFGIVRKNGKVYLTLAKDQLDKEFYEHATTANGLGGFGILSGDDFQQPARIVKFERINDKQVALLLPQYRFEAERGTAIDNAVKASTADSVVAVMPVAAEDKATGRVVVDPAFMLGDTLDLANALNEIVDNPNDPNNAMRPKNPQGAYHYDAGRSYFGPSKAFPKNVIIEAEQTFASTKPDTINTVTDPHSIVMRVKYNLSEILSTPGYIPRLADDRVGYWQDPHVNFNRDDRIDNIERFVLRWNLRASDPSRPSDAVKPIVYTLTNTIPDRYRAPIREAILEWNKAFERIGIRNAVQVVDQPSDPSWDPDDIRYNTIRWLTEANGGGFAEAQIEWDPRTGEIFRGGVLIDSDMMRYGKFEYGDLVAPSSGGPVSSSETTPGAGQVSQRSAELWDPADLAGVAPRKHHASGFIHRDTGGKIEAAFGALSFVLSGEEVPPSYTHDFLKAIVLHEVGHDFGLAHNFIGHNAYTAKELKSKAFTSVNGVASTVMEYAPVNIWPKNSPHGDYYQTVLGPYDYHVIHWGYAPAGGRTSDEEVPTLNRWAQASVDPKFAFASDEDNEYNGHAVDPRIATFMLTNDSIGWCQTQLGIDRDLIRTIDSRYPRPGMPWDQERFAFSLLLGQYGRCAQAMTHYMAGEHLSRARRGDPHAPPPLTPISRDEERRAFSNLDKYLFSDSAWQISSSTLRRLVYSEYEAFVDFGYKAAPRHDLSLSAIVAGYQNRALGYMFTPLVLQRLADLPSKSATFNPMTTADLFTWTQDSVYGDLARNAPARSSIHRNLQRSYARFLERMAIAPLPGTPYDAQALAHHELVSLAGNVRHSLTKRGLDLQTRAHLEALGEEVRRTLDTRDVSNVRT